MRKALITTLLSALFATALSLPGTASAQEHHSHADVERARVLYADGLAAIDDGRWADALGAFTTSYELSGAAPALFNVALVLRGLGRMREARDTLDRLSASLDDASITQIAAAMRAEAAARVAVLAIDGLPESGSVLFDGAPLTYGPERPFHLEIDPGDHTLAIDVVGFEPFVWQGLVADGARQTVAVELVPRSETPLWPWLVGGGAALLVVGAVILGVVLGTQGPSLAWPTLPHT